MQQRHTRILDILSKKSSATVAELSKALGISEVTIRKDLSHLEKQGLLQRGHGFAALMPEDDIGNRLSFHYDVKQRIAQRAAESVADGETVFIESGSCCALLADALAKVRREITVITNSAFIADFIRKYPNAHTVLLGGEYQKEAQVMVGSLVRSCVQNFYVDKLFVGIDGFHERAVMGNNLARAEAVRAMAEHAKKTIILTDSAKFSRTGVVTLLPLERIHGIYTDDGIDPKRRDCLAGFSIELHVVPARAASAAQSSGSPKGSAKENRH